MKMIRIIKILIGAAGWIWCAIPLVFNGILNAGNGAGMLFFGCLFLWGIFQKRLNEKARSEKWAKWIRGILITGYSAFILLFAVESAFMIDAITSYPTTEDTTVIVLGCSVKGETPSLMLKLRIDAAEKYLKENPSAKAILSGGKGSGEDISEALCMYRELTASGIDPDRLYMEDRSTSTRENIAFSKEIIEKEALSRNIAVVSNNFHLYRASLSVKAAGLDYSGIPAFSPYTSLLTYIMREYLGIAAQWVTG